MSAFRKHNPAAPEGFFEAEAAGLAWLAQAGGARAVRVLGVGADWIELDGVVQAPPTEEAARDFGAALARTHAAGADLFGSPPAGWDGPLYIGSRRMPGIVNEQWGEFYARGRVEPFLEPALESGHLRDAEYDVVIEACDAIAAGSFDDATPPARLHGDLWAGNVLFDAHGAVLIDPAAHGGHPETDLAMLALFGAPHLGAMLDAYERAGTLAAGWRRRVPVHQLHPLAVHAAGHGRSYGIELAAAARAALDLLG